MKRFFDVDNIGRSLAILTVAGAMVAVAPAFDVDRGMAAQTKTATAKKKSAAASGSQKKASSPKKASPQKNASSPKKASGSQSQKKGTQSQKKTSATGKKQSGRSKGKSTQPSGPKSSAEAKKMQEDTQRDIQQTKEKLRLNEQQIKTGLSDLNRLSSEIAAGRTQVAGLQKKVAGLNTQISNLGTEITKNEAELKLMRDEYLKAVKKMRLTKKNQSTLAFIFASENFNQAMRRIRYMRQFSAWKERKSADIDGKIEQLGKERENLAKAKDAQTVALGQLTKSQEALEANHKKQETLVATLRQNGDALQTHLTAKQNEANRLKETISNLIAQEQAKAEAERRAREKAEAERKAKAEAERLAREKAEAERLAAEKAKAYRKAQEDKEKADRKFAEAKAKADEKARKEQEKLDKKKFEDSQRTARRKGDRRLKSSVEVKDAAKAADPVAVATPKTVEKKAVKETVSKVNFASLRGSLPRPVDGSWRITNQFGRHAMPEMPEIQYDNPGIDAEVAKGATVKSVCGGKVSGVYKLSGYGNVVIVNHGDYYTVYGNLGSTNVSVGTQVGSGTALGTAGSDPDDPRRGSVHFEVWKGREKQNPSAWLR